jgi:hypothetical protein
MCVACSEPVLERYRQGKEAFVAEIAVNPVLLEKISGIEKMTENVDLDLCIDSDEDF